MLFGTEGLEFESCAICSRIRYGEDEKWAALESLAPIGAERGWRTGGNNPSIGQRRRSGSPSRG